VSALLRRPAIITTIIIIKVREVRVRKVYSSPDGQLKEKYPADHKLNVTKIQCFFGDKTAISPIPLAERTLQL